jgi:hypothetical protein
MIAFADGRGQARTMRIRAGKTSEIRAESTRSAGHEEGHRAAGWTLLTVCHLETEQRQRQGQVP